MVGELLKPEEITNHIAMYFASYVIAHKDDKEECAKVTECAKMVEKILWWNKEEKIDEL